MQLFHRLDSEPNSRVIVEFGAQGKQATADAEGKWEVTLDPLKASDKMVKLDVTKEEGNLSLPISRVEAKPVDKSHQ